MDKIIIPFGEECYTCQCIDSKFTNNGFRHMGFPFDYVGHTYIENIFDNVFDLLKLNENLCKIDNFSKEKLNDMNQYYYSHNKYNFKYWHDNSKNDFTEEENNNFIEKYNRRYNRLKDYLENYDNLIIFSVNHFDNIYNKIFKQSSVYKLFNLLQSYNKNIKFIAVNYGEEIYNSTNLEFINLPVNYNLNFTESKQLFSKSLNEFVKSAFE